MNLLLSCEATGPIANSNPERLIVPVDELVAPVEITYITALHDKPRDFDDEWEEDVQRADIVFHEEAGWVADYRTIMRQIARGAIDPSHITQTDTYSYRRLKAIFNTSGEQDFWDLRARSPEAQHLPKLMTAYHANHVEAEALMREGKDEPAIGAMTKSHTALARYDELRDREGVARVSNRLVALQEKRAAKGDDGVYEAVVFTGLAHVFQAAAIAKQQPKSQVFVRSQFSELATMLNTSPYLDYLSEQEVSPQSSARAWLMSAWLMRKRLQSPNKSNAVISNDLAPLVSAMDYDDVIKNIIKSL
ncbi:MAG TPA: hypothetical protein VGF75_05055 [Candidatus Saccharimonadales bacterium]